MDSDWSPIHKMTDQEYYSYLQEKIMNIEGGNICHRRQYSRPEGLQKRQERRALLYQARGNSHSR